MPNTLAHFGVQGLLGHRFLHGIDPKWILLGCVIPDVPWIFQRVVRSLPLPVDLYDLRLYVICQASLVGCVVLSAAMAFLFPRPKKAFVVLAINSFAHLLLDSTQLKWANGVHLFAPFSWELWNLGWYWPENIVTYGITSLGLVYLLIIWRSAVNNPLIPIVPAYRSSLLAVMCLAVYFLFPFTVISAAEQADNHYVKTLRETEVRIGRVVEFDRVQYIKKESGGVIRTISNEHLKVETHPLARTALVSIKGRFTAPDVVEVEDLHIHSSWFRDAASMAGLLILVILCLVSMIRGSDFWGRL